MYANQPPPILKTRHHSYDYPMSSRSNFDVSLPQNRFSLYTDRSTTGQQSLAGSAANNYVPPNTGRFSIVSNHRRTNSTGSTSTGAIEKTNMMSSENPFVDPARPYEQQFSATRTITSITSPRKSDGAVNKSLNLSDENPFFAVYGNYRYPTQVDPSKRITTQNSSARSTDSKSLYMSDENPFAVTYERYKPPTITTTSQSTFQKRLSELSPIRDSSFSSNGLAHSSSFSSYSYRPSLIRQYSAGELGNELNLSTVSTSIADWTRNNPAPLSYRPIHVQRPPAEYYNHNEPSYVPPPSSPRQQQQPLPPPPSQQQSLPSPRPAPTISSQSSPRKSNGSLPLDKTSLNMSPDNPFAATYGRYHYPSPDEIRTQRRENERTVRFADEVMVNESRPSNSNSDHSDTEKKETTSNKGKSKFARFDITL
ncbi:unnamed protein product [Adineta ricciae]|uniref:Uncharacterized protein n=1 Tax=Adineta ricciae TaxID=249248 RepID=A0A813TQ18_ADIRI|nr:unnamed protein product [Adineta ricciae]CAF1258524.1 unnamed protein product [Adineta ricciae]